MNDFSGWPKLLLQVLQLDSLSRCWLVGYGCCSIPITPGHHQIEIPCWLPAADTIADRVRQFFLGGSHQLLKPDVFLLGSDRLDLLLFHYYYNDRPTFILIFLFLNLQAQIKNRVKRQCSIEVRHNIKEF